MQPTLYFKAQFANDFSHVSGNLLKLCLNEGGHLLGWEHLSYLNRLSENKLSENMVTELSIPYVYLASSFFCQDHVFDNDSYNDLEILAPSVFLAAANNRFVNLSSNNAEDIQVITDLLSELMTNFADAMLEEKRWMKDNNKGSAYNHVVGRSSLFLFGYKLVTYLKGEVLDENNLDVFKNFIYFMQCGDDLGDWREDFQANKLTPTLAVAFEKLGSKNVTEEKLEEFIYLSGFYEMRCDYVIDGLNSIIGDVREIFGEGAVSLVGYIEMQIERATAVQNQFKNVKAGISIKNPPEFH